MNEFVALWLLATVMGVIGFVLGMLFHMIFQAEQEKGGFDDFDVY